MVTIPFVSKRGEMMISDSLRNNNGSSSVG